MRTIKVSIWNIYKFIQCKYKLTFWIFLKINPFKSLKSSTFEIWYSLLYPLFTPYSIYYSNNGSTIPKFHSKYVYKYLSIVIFTMPLSRKPLYATPKLCTILEKLNMHTMPLAWLVQIVGIYTQCSKQERCCHAAAPPPHLLSLYKNFVTVSCSPPTGPTFPTVIPKHLHDQSSACLRVHFLL